MPVHQRLILLCADFLESATAAKFKIHDLFSFQGKLTGLEQSMPRHKAEKLQRLIKELFKKYQLEILQPNIDYVVDKIQTAFEKYQAEEKARKSKKLGDQRNYIPKVEPADKVLVKFKHSTYDKR